LNHVGDNRGKGRHPVKVNLSLIGEPERDTQCDLLDKFKKIEGNVAAS